MYRRAFVNSSVSNECDPSVSQYSLGEHCRCTMGWREDGDAGEGEAKAYNEKEGRLMAEVQDMVFEFPGAGREVATGIDLVVVGEVDIAFRYHYYQDLSALLPFLRWSEGLVNSSLRLRSITFHASQPFQLVTPPSFLYCLDIMTCHCLIQLSDQAWVLNFLPQVILGFEGCTASGLEEKE